MEGHLSDKNFYVPTWPRPESSPSLPQIEFKLLPLCSLIKPFNSPFQPRANVQTHAPKEKDHRGKKHKIEDEVFVHDFISAQRPEGIAHRVNTKKEP
jgi:hypothetical protein